MEYKDFERGRQQLFWSGVCDWFDVERGDYGVKCCIYIFCEGWRGRAEGDGGKGVRLEVSGFLQKMGFLSSNFKGIISLENSQAGSTQEISLQVVVAWFTSKFVKGNCRLLRDIFCKPHLHSNHLVFHPFHFLLVK